MVTSENQKIIIISKEASDKKHPYSIISLEASDVAAWLLSGNEFKLWYYLAKNQNNYRFAISRKSYVEWSGSSASTYTRTIKTLIDLEYLVPKEEESNVYIFYELPEKCRERYEESKNQFLTVEVPDNKRAEITEFEMS